MNFASRVESANKQFKSRVLISDDVYQEIKESLIIKDFMRTTIKGIEGRVTLHEVDQIHLTGEREKIKQNQKVEDGLNWNKCGKIESFDSSPQQVFKIKRESILIAKVDLACKLLGWTAKRSLKDICKDNWRWQKSNFK